VAREGNENSNAERELNFCRLLMPRFILEWMHDDQALIRHIYAMHSLFFFTDEGTER
jgi:hypothetical protein